MSVAGTYDTTVKSPMGDQKGTLTVNPDGDSWTGQMAGGMGSMDITDGKVDGDTITWSMNMTVPMPMTLNCTATIAGDALTGTVNAGAFGDMPLTGTRQGRSDQPRTRRAAGSLRRPFFRWPQLCSQFSTEKSNIRDVCAPTLAIPTPPPVCDE